MVSTKRWQGRFGLRLGLQHGLTVGWFLLVGAVAVMLLPGPAGSAGAPASLGEQQTVTSGGQSHCGVVVGIGASDGGSGSGDTNCVSVQAGGDSQVNTRGFGDIGMQFQHSPVNAAVTNVHISNEGDHNSNNTIVGDDDLIVNKNVGVSGFGFGAGAAEAAAPVAAAPVGPRTDDQRVSALPVNDPAPAPAPTPQAAANHGGQSHCGVVVGIGASDGGSGSGDTECVTVQAGGDSQVNTRGFGDIGMQFQQSPVNAPITNVHISNGGDNNSNNTIVGDHSWIINGNLSITINA